MPLFDKPPPAAFDERLYLSVRDVAGATLRACIAVKWYVIAYGASVMLAAWLGHLSSHSSMRLVALVLLVEVPLLAWASGITTLAAIRTLQNKPRRLSQLALEAIRNVPPYVALAFAFALIVAIGVIGLLCLPFFIPVAKAWPRFGPRQGMAAVVGGLVALTGIFVMVRYTLVFTIMQIEGWRRSAPFARSAQLMTSFVSPVFFAVCVLVLWSGVVAAVLSQLHRGLTPFGVSAATWTFVISAVGYLRAALAGCLSVLFAVVYQLASERQGSLRDIEKN